jgi:serine/threonine-protein kinase RsbW
MEVINGMVVDYSQDQRIYSQDIMTDTYGVCQEVKDILRELSDRFSLAYEQCFDIKIILSELLQNAIKHGNKCDTNKKIHIDIWFKEQSKTLGIRIKDQGHGFDSPSKYISKNLSEGEPMLNESGRGLNIVKALSDGIKFNTEGNTITVLKKI